MNTILDYLENTTKKNGWKTAVDDGNICMTWNELRSLSEKLGSAFSRRTAPGMPVAVLMKKSAVTLASMFGAVYAGCFYSVIDPAQPVERIRRILQVLEPGVVLINSTCEGLMDQIGYQGPILSLQEAMREKEDRDILKDIRRQSSEKDLLYCMFTSGTTGTPKGIAVSHKSVIDFITHFTEQFHITDEDRIGNQAPFDFDVSVKDIFSCVFTGATLFLIPPEYFSVPPVLLDYLCGRNITTLIWAASALTVISSLKGLDYKVPGDVNKVLFSGEVMPLKQLKRWQRALPEAVFVNLYGPTEITCNCTWYPISNKQYDQESIPIGKALPGRKVFLLSNTGEIVSPKEGGKGEICVSGESLAEGYYHNPEETMKCFRIWPETQERYYCTGDLGYYGKNGELYFSGRKDFQIKHMGHRIELEEVESAINRIDGVEKSCCIYRQESKQLLAVYMGSVSEKKVREDVKKQLPDFMIPQKIQQVEKFPLTKNGKTDRRVLAEQYGE